MLTQSICRECMAAEKTAAFSEGEQVGKPAAWNTTVYGVLEIDDEWLWRRGRVFCPHSRVDKSFDMALANCLHKKAQQAAADGVLVVFEEGLIETDLRQMPLGV